MSSPLFLPLFSPLSATLQTCGLHYHRKKVTAEHCVSPCMAFGLQPTQWNHSIFVALRSLQSCTSGGGEGRGFSPKYDFVMTIAVNILVRL